MYYAIVLLAESNKGLPMGGGRNPYPARKSKQIPYPAEFFGSIPYPAVCLLFTLFVLHISLIVRVLTKKYTINMPYSSIVGRVSQIYGRLPFKCATH